MPSGGLSPIVHPLDVTDDANVAALAATLRTRRGGADIVISNAAARISHDVPPAGQVDVFVNTNNHGTYRMIRAFAPLLRDNARFLVVASSFGSLHHLPPTLHEGFDVTTRALEDIEQLMDDYLHLVEAGRRGILINAVCPGLVDTDASRPWFKDMSTAQSPAQAAVDVLWLAMLPAGTEAP